MPDQQVPVTRTVITPQGYARAVIAAWRVVGQGLPEKDDVGVLFAQWMVETGGAACWNWNLSNAKYTPGCGFDYMCLNGVWEGIEPITAANMVAAGRAIRDPSPDHAKAVGAGKVSVIFPPPQPESRFRAFPDLSAGMVAHLKLLHERFAASWQHVLDGDPVGTAHVLGTLHYFTANADVYGAGMARHYAAFMKTSAYELALDDMAETQAAVTQPDGLPNPASQPTIVVDPVLHVDPSLYLGNEPPDDVA